MSEEQSEYEVENKPYSGFLEFAAAVEERFGEGEYARAVFEFGVSHLDRWPVFNTSQKFVEKRLAELRALTETLQKTSPKSPE